MPTIEILAKGTSITNVATTNLDASVTSVVAQRLLTVTQNLQYSQQSMLIHLTMMCCCSSATANHSWISSML